MKLFLFLKNSVKYISDIFVFNSCTVFYKRRFLCIKQVKKGMFAIQIYLKDLSLMMHPGYLQPDPLDPSFWL